MTFTLLLAVKRAMSVARAWVARATLCFRRWGYLSAFKKIIEPRSIDEDMRRREYILNIILIVSISALLTLGTTLVWNYFHVQGYAGMHPLIFLVIIIFYGGMFYLSKCGKIRTSSIMLILCNMAGTLYVGWHWGASLPETLLLTVLTIVIASVLIGSTAGFIIAGLMILGLTVFGIHESIYLNVPDWRYDEITVTDVITYSVMFLFISFITWLSNKEIDRSLIRARKSEKMLAVERDTLEQRVSERTEELILSQQKRILEIGHTTRVGELARGIIHDLMNPLSSIALYMEEISTHPERYDTGATHIMIEKALQASHRMKSFMESTRHFIDPKQIHENTETNLKNEIIMACDVVAYKARLANVHIEIGTIQNIILHAHPLRINQIFINLLSNAIDACSSGERKGEVKIISINANTSESDATIIVADNGCGMNQDKVQELYMHPKTTKPEGSGIGFMNIYSIVKKELGGTISITSSKEVGTTIIITLPLHTHGKNSSINQS